MLSSAAYYREIWNSEMRDRKVLCRGLPNKSLNRTASTWRKRADWRDRLVWLFFYSSPSERTLFSA